MSERLSAACDAFSVEIDEPHRGDRELHVGVVFAPGGKVDRATIELQLYARKHSGVLRAANSWDTEAAVPGTKAVLERGETGRLRFTRPIPPFVRTFRGTGLEVAVVVVTEGDDGSRLVLALEPLLIADDARLLVRGLPLTQALSLGPVRGFRRDPPVATFEEMPGGAIAITVRAAGSISGGHVRLEALEYEREHGKHLDWAPPIVAVEAALARVDAGQLRAEVRLPEATAAPASIECSWATRTQGIRWLARFELEDAHRKVVRAAVPIHVGVERSPDARQP